MPNLNKVFLMGNLTRDPELRYTPGGTAVASFGLAVNRKYRSQSGEDREDTLFVDVTAFARQAEIIGEYMSKGRPIFIEGRLHLDQWEDKQSGSKRSKLSVTIENFQFIGGRDGGKDGGGSQRGGSSRGPSRPSGPPAPSDDDIPF
jgi:single-strand DNA-binding protein